MCVVAGVGGGLGTVPEHKQSNHGVSGRGMCCARKSGDRGQRGSVGLSMSGISRTGEEL